MKEILLIFTILFLSINVIGQTNQKNTHKKSNSKEFIQLAILKNGKIFVNRNYKTYLKNKLPIIKYKDKNFTKEF